jgi:hypothetical protein
MNTTSVYDYKNPEGYEIDFSLLQDFERNLNTSSPESCSIPCRVLGYGEISTVFEIQAKGMRGLAFKRMSVFEAAEELRQYLVTYQLYNRILVEETGINMPPHGHAALENKAGRPIFYIIQQKVSPDSIGNNTIHLLPREEISRLFQCVLRDLQKIWEHNQHQPDCLVGIDGQISNWVITDFDASHPYLDEHTSLAYIDTSTPFLRLQEVEQMDSELFLRSAPRSLAWILRWFFLKDVLDRYYDFRKVVIDLIANFYKEQRPDLVPGLLDAANNFFLEKAAELEVKPIEEQEVRAYYREDALIWRLYLNMRRLDCFIYTKILRHEYPYILPGKINR